MATKHRRVAFVLSNPATSVVTGWPIGFWLSELTHPNREFVDAGFEVTLYSPDGGAVHVDDFSDPYAEHGYSADDEVSKAFLGDASTKALLDDTRQLDQLLVGDAEVLFLVGGQGPMQTFRSDPQVERVVREFHAAGKPTVVVCHATCVLLDATDAEGRLLVTGRRWTGFTADEERIVEQNVGQRIQPFFIEDEAASICDTTFVAGQPFASHVVADGNLITGQQQNSGAEAARVAIASLA